MSPKSLLAAAALCAGAFCGQPASASDILHCTFPDGFKFYISTTDDNSSRVGVEPGIGDKGVTIFDTWRNGARVVIEYNGSGVPITMTTIQKDGTAVHSRQIVDALGTLVAPSQQTGRCETTYAVDGAVVVGAQ